MWSSRKTSGPSLSAATPRQRTRSGSSRASATASPPHSAYSLGLYPGFTIDGMTRVLLAEDDLSISEPLSRALRREGYQVEVTADGPTTLHRALQDGADLILLDL